MSGDPDFFEDYPDWLDQLGHAIAMDAAAGQPWLTNWPVWRAEPLAASTVLPESLSTLHLKSRLHTGR